VFGLRVISRALLWGSMGVVSKWSCLKWARVLEVLSDDYYFAESVGCYIHETQYSGGSQ
jgi:hypothetical protein